MEINPTIPIIAAPIPIIAIDTKPNTSSSISPIFIPLAILFINSLTIPSPTPVIACITANNILITSAAPVINPLRTVLKTFTTLNTPIITVLSNSSPCLVGSIASVSSLKLSDPSSIGGNTSLKASPTVFTIRISPEYKLRTPATILSMADE